ncbi:gfo/Idh/MocA family oxidoreductase [Salibacterium salarium]|uniref:Gfo/Idh/MocA family oxidoreductase n=1 Tax=Salibacterium salarium TaxID=284579 RepID=A0A3R9P391_9BACI|nr:Gfo/Idh/MocA family oxidoreductase [Salibacterium salarium]RSL30128.1 gfo/Idh/MocA family oxidoreductase [Salibacterium salarium]
MNIGTIGTNWITEAFIEAGKLADDFYLYAVYSRDEKKAEQFRDKHGADTYYADLAAMLRDEKLDGVYIASPTRYHAEQAMMAMENGKHVICEKPLCSNAREAEQLMETAEKYNVVLMEAIKTLYVPSFHELQQWLPKVGTVRKAIFSYCQYSSRYDAYLNGEVLNAFKPSLSNGATMDIGVYCLHPMLYLFGEPRDTKASGYVLESGVDGEANVLLDYDGMDAVASYSKITASSTPSEIQGEKGTLYVQTIHRPEKITFVPIKGEKEEIEFSKDVPDMYYEAEFFVDVCKKSIMDNLNWDNSKRVMQQTDRIREQLGVEFDADQTFV